MGKQYAEAHSDKKQEYGPGWYDVWVAAREIEKLFGGTVIVSTQANTGRDHKWGLHFCAQWTEGERVAVAYASYGPAYPGNGSKTVSAAQWSAVNKLHWQLTNMRDRAVQPTQESLLAE